ncbi:hypothetical protein [uncultured Friedmanniella sp.]|uniref:hypothetical protein n=1 Tax=uncultured Friedmanniella sp. TaxID=335381 RepID=UPI0035C9B3C7
MTARPAALGVRQVWLADALRWCRRNQVPASVLGLRRCAAAVAALIMLGGAAALVGVAALLGIVMAALTGRPGDLAGLLPWLLLVGCARLVVLGVLPAQRAAIARPADVDVLDACEASRLTVWQARVLLPGMTAAATTTVLALAVVAQTESAVPAGLVAWCLLPVPVSVLSSQVSALLARSGRELSVWVLAVPAALLGLALGRQLGHWLPAVPHWDDATVLHLVGRVASSGVVLTAFGWVFLGAGVLGCGLTFRSVIRELRGPWPGTLERPQRPVRSVLAAEVRRGRRLATRVHRRLAGGLVLVAALSGGLAAALPWWSGPSETVMIGLAGTVGLLLAVSVVASQGPLVHVDTLRWLVDAGLPAQRVVARHLSETLWLLAPTLVPVSLALAVVGRLWWLAPVAVLLAVCLLLAACWADLIDPTREQQPDGTTESGVVAGLLTALVCGLLVAPHALLPTSAALGWDLVVTAAVAVVARRRLSAELHAASPLSPVV